MSKVKYLLISLFVFLIIPTICLAAPPAKPGGNGAPGGNTPGGNSTSVSYKGANKLTSNKTFENKTFKSTTGGENTLYRNCFLMCIYLFNNSYNYIFKEKESKQLKNILFFFYILKI